MSVYLYDEALINRIRTVIQDKKVHIITPEKMFTKSNDKHDAPKFPAVSIYRPSYNLSTLRRTITGYRVGQSDYDEVSARIYSTKTLPISINYQVDVWTRKREQNDEFVRELLWFFTLFPQHKIIITYEDFERAITFNAFLGEEIIDNSDINNFENYGQYYRSTFNLTVDEAQLFMVDTTPKPSFGIKVQSYDLKGNLLDETIFDIPHEEGVSG